MQESDLCFWWVHSLTINGEEEEDRVHLRYGWEDVLHEVFMGDRKFGTLQITEILGTPRFGGEP